MLSSTYIFVCVVFLLQPSNQQSTDKAGLKIGISNRGINYAADIAVDLLTDELTNKQINDASGSNGDFKYEISNIQIKEFVKPNTNVLLNAESSLVTWSLSNGRIRAHFGWHYEYKKNRFLRFSDGGSATVTASNIRISVNFKFDYDSNTGRPKVFTTACECNIGDLDTDFHGGNSWLYNLLAGAVKDPLKSQLAKEVCRAAEKAVNGNGNEELESLETEVSLGNKLFLDYKLTNVPAIKPGSVEFASVGCIFVQENKKCPLSQPPMSVNLSAKMLTAVISEESLNSYLSAMYLSGQMILNLTKNSFDGSEGDFLNADCKSGFCFSRLLTRLAKTLPNSSFEISYYVKEIPVVHISDGSIRINISSKGYINARFQNNTVVELFSIEVVSSPNVAIFLKNNDFIGFKISNLKPEIVFDNSTHEDVQKGVKFGIKVVAQFTEKRINKIGEEGIPLPKIDKVILQNSEISLNNRYIVIQSDVRYVG